MPEGNDSYYTNAADRSQDRYEDYIVNDLIAHVEQQLPAAAGRANRAIVGVSMGGFGAVKLALKRPDLFAFVGGISPAVDVPSRPFSIKRPLQWRYHRSIFGPWGGRVQQENDPFVLARSADPGKIPYIFLTCSDQEGLLPANRKLAAILTELHVQHEFHVVRGGHDWTQWDKQLEMCFQSLAKHMKAIGSGG
jgi:S-formylglutathione hydrolase FrmB